MDFGEKIKSEFLLNKEVIFLNHAAYPSLPRDVLEHRLKLIRDQERDPENFFRKRIFKMHKNQVDYIAQFVATDAENLCLTESTTHSINSILMSVPLKAGDTILLQTFTFSATRRATERIADLRGLNVISLDIKLPIKSIDEILNLYERSLNENPGIKLVLVDHISSSVPILWPIKQLVNLCKSKNRIVVVDGAHGPGQVQLNLDDLNADFYTGSLYKWNFVPRGCGLLYVDKKYHNCFSNIHTSQRFGSRPFQIQFIFYGTRDYSPMYCWDSSRKFIDKCGGNKKIDEYNKTLLRNGWQLLVKAWKTDIFNVPDDMRAPSMTLIKVPKLSRFSAENSVEFEKKFREKFNIEVFAVYLYGEFWFRLSVQIYNTLKDFEILRDSINSLL
ncbi:DgyrCDS7080 [Dimorphilus gyrociliatus]|uniref:DgyrCDS7080 n=1 Tax=Dimorphilus gyrociliatus TaxID=2664684 RepID=A0A7I8VRL3_9ANNE|nr:DgyrCDS7080 [Dimorphilus gyrociliatus]